MFLCLLLQAMVLIFFRDHVITAADLCAILYFDHAVDEALMAVEAADKVLATPIVFALRRHWKPGPWPKVFISILLQAVELWRHFDDLTPALTLGALVLMNSVILINLSIHSVNSLRSKKAQCATPSQPGRREFKIPFLRLYRVGVFCEPYIPTPEPPTKSVENHTVAESDGSEHKESIDEKAIPLAADDNPVSDPSSNQTAEDEDCDGKDVTRDTSPESLASAKNEHKEATQAVTGLIASGTLIQNAEEVDGQVGPVQTETPVGGLVVAVRRSVGRTFRVPSYSSSSSDEESDGQTGPRLMHINEALAESDCTTLRLIDGDGFRIEKRLGEGTYGTVDMVSHSSLTRLFALKSQNKGYENEPCTEGEVLARLKFGRIVEVIGLVPDVRAHRLLLEHCDVGCLDTFVGKNRGRYPDATLWQAFRHIAEGLAWIHERGFVHGDLKPGNVLLKTNSVQGLFHDLVISDFGTAIQNPNPDIPRSHLGTHCFAPPEGLERFTAKADVWALGCIIHFMAHKDMPKQLARSPPKWASEEACQQQELQNLEDTRKDIIWPEVYCGLMFHTSSWDFFVCPLISDDFGAMGGNTYPKILSFLMLKALEMEEKDRMTAADLAAVLPVLQNLYIDLAHLGHLDIMDMFRDGVVSGQRAQSPSLSQALGGIARNLVRRLHGSGVNLVELVNPLLPFLDPETL